MKHIHLILAVFISSVALAQGPYAPNADAEGTTAIHYLDESIISWASGCEVTRGLQDISDPSSDLANVGNASDGIGAVGENSIVSLGDGGSAILTFDTPIFNGPGFDFAVFENSFSHTFLELAFVEVSSDGVNYFRFPSVSLTQTDTQIDGFGDLDPTNIYNLAGKYKAQYGTPFDLEELKNEIGLDINNITHIKLIDVVGSIDPDYASYDSEGKIINDPYATPFPSGGFDLDAIGVMNTILSIKENTNTTFALYPNPTTGVVYISSLIQDEYTITITNIQGEVVLYQSEQKSNIKKDLTNLKKGIYIALFEFKNETYVKRIVIE